MQKLTVCELCLFGKDQSKRQAIRKVVMTVVHKDDIFCIFFKVQIYFWGS